MLDFFIATCVGMAVAGIVNSLWDLRGRIEGKPVGEYTLITMIIITTMMMTMMTMRTMMTVIIMIIMKIMMKWITGVASLGRSQSRGASQAY